MSDQEPVSLNTRWSMLDRLQGSEADDGWRWFIERYQPFVRTCLHRVMRSANDAGAAEQEIWSYLFTSEVFAKADRSRRFRGFLAGVIRNFAHDWRRRNWHAQADTEDGEKLEPVALVELPEDEEMRLFARHVLHLAMEELHRSHRENALALRWFYGVPEDPGSEFDSPLSATVIAERLEIVPNAVHQVLHRGRKRLRVLVENELRETVREAADLEDELELMLGAMQQYVPGMGS